MVQGLYYQIAALVYHVFELPGINETTRDNIGAPHYFAGLPVNRNYHYHYSVLGKHPPVAQHHAAQVTYAQAIDIHMPGTYLTGYLGRL